MDNPIEEMPYQDAEHAAWREVVRQLEETGAVTKQDGESPATARDTPGQRLYAALREWGSRLAGLRHVQRDHGAYYDHPRRPQGEVVASSATLAGLRRAISAAKKARDSMRDLCESGNWGKLHDAADSAISDVEHELSFVIDRLDPKLPKGE